jgi:predicted AlkP superfamily pyrophosphatase or phosphodiesterase
LHAGITLLILSATLRGQPRHVIVIGIDGLSADAVAKADVPHIGRLMRRGAWTLSARGVMPTLSSPNWASMITGAGTEQHGITSNGWFRRMVEFRPICQGPDGKFPTIFDALHQQRPDAGIAIFHEWGGFADLVSRDSVDVMRHERGPARTAEAAMQYWIEKKPALLFVHLDHVDHAGHRHGWGSAPYNRAVNQADHHVGEVLAMLDASWAAGSTFVLVTSDHGGTARGHSKNSLREMQIPWILTGPGVVPGEIRGHVNTFDTAATLAWILGLDPLPCAIGRPVLAAFPPRLSFPAAALRNTPQCAPESAAAGALTRPLPSAQTNE